MGYDDLIEQVDQSIKVRRALLRLIESLKFEQLWHLAEKLDQQLLKEAIERGDLITVKTWVLRQKDDRELGEMTRRELMGIAKNLGIPGWSRSSLPDLIKYIEEHQNAQKQSIDATRNG